MSHDTPTVDTIVALATPPGRGGIAVVRVSGPQAAKIAYSVTQSVLKPRVATYLPFLDEQGIALDEGIALYFKAPNSFTGEDVLELQGHGGPAVVDLLIKRAMALGARLAKPGEFSERAFLNDKLDLAQAEAIADLIEASSEQAARSALRSLQGEFSEQIHLLVERLIYLRLYVEAAIDFAEEEIDFMASQEITNGLQQALSTLKDIVAHAKVGSLLRDGITLVITGEPNVGKSSLLNRLSGKDLAIVTEIPGTTRDVLRHEIHLNGMPLHIIDTAGLRVSTDPVEQEGIRRAHREIAEADIILWLTALEESAAIPDFAKLAPKAHVIHIKNKRDLLGVAPYRQVEKGMTELGISVKNNLGLDLLRDHIQSVVGYAANMEGCFSARRRHLDALSRAEGFLQSGVAQLQDHRALELLAEDLRLAQQALNEITGEFTSDDLLGRIFASFCIGK